MVGKLLNYCLKMEKSFCEITIWVGFCGEKFSRFVWLCEKTFASLWPWLDFTKICVLLLHAQVTKVQKNTMKLSLVFALWGSPCVKGAHRMLVKLTPWLDNAEESSYHVRPILSNFPAFLAFQWVFVCVRERGWNREERDSNCVCELCLWESVRDRLYMCVCQREKREWMGVSEDFCMLERQGC